MNNYNVNCTLTKSISKKERQGAMLSAIICCAYCVSVLVFNIGNLMIPHLLFLLWVISLIFIDAGLVRKIFSRSYFSFFYLFLFYYFVASLAQFGIVTCVNRVIVMFELIAPMVMYEIYSAYGMKPKRMLFYTITILAIVNIYSLRQNISVEVGLKQHADEEGFMNIAYHWVYCMSILEGLICYLLRKIWNDNFKHKTIIILCLISLAVTMAFVIVLSLYATAIIIMLITIIMSLLYGRKKWLRKMIVSAIVAVVLFNYFLPVVINVLEKINPESTMYAKRAIELAEMSHGEVDYYNNSGGARLARSWISIETFLIHPIMGLTPFTEDVVAEPPVIPGTKIGNHAEWLDDLGLYGIWAFSLFAFLWKYSKRLYKDSDIAFIFIAFIILGFLNKCFYIVHMTLLFLYAPIMYDYIMSLKKCNTR